jgi:putative membrane protein
MQPRRLMTTAAALALASLAPLSLATAQDTAPKDSIQADAKFVHQATRDNALEVRLGEVAQRRATSPMVQKFAQRMVAEHTRMEKQWVDLARKHGLEVESGLGPAGEQRVSRFRQADKASFDKEYMIAMIKGHAEDAASLQFQIDSARSEPVRKMAAYALPIVRDHLLAARAAGKEVGVDSATVADSKKMAETH